MEEIIKLIADYGVMLVLSGAFLYYGFKQQQQNEEIVKAMNEMYKNLALINEKLGIKISKEK
ncbi:hypothetical protein J6W34_07200 [bacterium]|nr:hypothetical protein [bacterium]